MSAFDDALKRFAVKVETQSQAVFVNVASAVQHSITDGSAVTGAPGQPVDTGNLKASWHLEFETPTSALISTNVEYAPIIEYNERGATLRSKVGGFHSVALTRAGLPLIVADEAKKVAP